MKSKQAKKKKPIKFDSNDTVRTTPVDGLPRSVLQALVRNSDK